jgi:TRAP-type C4-dicarboxylate transport system permease small subunit
VTAAIVVSLLRAIYNRVIDICGVVAAAVVLLLTFGITIEVATRALGVGAIEWMLEASEYSLLLMTFLGAPWALRQGAHVRVDVVLTLLPRSTALICEITANVLGMAASLVLLIWGWRAAAASAETASMVYKVLVFPEWWLYALIGFSGALLTAEFICRLRRSRRENLLVGQRPELL